MTLEQIREQGLAVLRKHLGVVSMVRFLQQAEMGSGNYTEERYQWLGDPDLEELAKKNPGSLSRPCKPDIDLVRSRMLAHMEKTRRSEDTSQFILRATQTETQVCFVR